MDGDPRDEIDAKAGVKQGEVIGPSETLGELTLSRDMMRMEAEQAMEFAMSHPRKLELVRRKIEQVVLGDEASAKACIYALPRAGKPIVGPSVGFTDALFANYGNCHRDDRLVEIDRKNKIVVCQGLFTDLESNSKTITTATRPIANKRGELFSADMIQVTTMACKRIAVRNATLQGVQRPIWYPYFQRALIMVRGTDATLPERIDELLKSFASHGVDPKRIAAALGVNRREEITLDMMVVLQGMWEQLYNGDISAEEMFDPRRMTGGAYEIDGNPLGNDAGSENPSPGPAGPGGGSTAPTDASGATSANGKAAGASSGAGQGSPPPAQNNEQAAAGPKPAQAKKEKPKAEEKPAETPKTPEAYKAYAEAWIMAYDSAEDVEKRWKAERQMRNQANLTSEVRDPLEAFKKARVAELAKGA